MARQNAWIRYGVPLAATLVVLGAAWILKEPCLEGPWGGQEFEDGCYTDVVPFWHLRGLADGQVPYVEAFNEYPPLSGMWMYASASIGGDAMGYFVAHAIGAGLLALATTAILARHVGQRSLWFAASPALALYALHNWDLLAVALAAGGLFAFHRGRTATAGALLGLGAAAKIYPGFLLVGLAAAAFRSDRATAWRLLGAGAIAGFLAHLPFLLLNAELLLEAYTFHLGRGPTYESPWRVVVDAGLPQEVPVLLQLGGLIAVVATAVRGRIGPLQAAVASLLVFLLTNVVYSVQYTLWVVALLPALRVPWHVKGAVLAADVLAWWALMAFLADLSAGAASDTWLVAASLLRAGVLAWLLWWVLGRPGHGTGDDTVRQHPAVRSGLL